MKKHHLVVGTIIGGILLAATMQSASTFALSDTSSTTDAPTSDTPDQTPSSDTTPAPVDGSIATGSTADQTVNNSVGSTSTNDASTGTTDNSTPAADPTVDPTIANGPSNGSSSDPSSSPSDTDATGSNNTTLTNNVGGTSQSGNATVSNNNVGGNASTGDASGITTLINALASASDLSGGLQTFTMNLNGNQNGNILLDPNALLTLSGNNTSGGSYNADLTNNSTINNNVDLSATSGDAGVTDNRHGGNATSGNATTEADIINLIESLISDQKAFLGVININGTLNGNILLPASVIDQLLKNGGGSTNPNSNVVATDNMLVNNNVSLSAQSGDASVVNNGHGGNATSGNATTKLNIYNLVNSQIVGGNVLLVFVNVMGNWYGLLMNAPAGTTSAALGGGISQSSMGDGDTSVPAGQVFATNNETINNNVTLTSKTGNATVSGNHRGGNATTGDASAVADIVNILGSQINLTGWLGILVINVFGTWNGSLQVQPAATSSSTGGSNHPGGPGHHTTHHGGNDYAYYINYAASFEPTVTTTTSHVLSDHTFQSNFSNDDQPVAVVFDHSKSNSKVMADALLAGLAATIAGAAGAARYFNNRKKNQQPPMI